MDREALLQALMVKYTFKPRDTLYDVPELIHDLTLHHEAC